jgi:uncharacterized hydrophobic protein (TIGR00271 family)
MFKFLGKYFSILQDLDSIENITESVNQGIKFRGTNLMVLVFAIFIASLGLNINSTPVVIGAMLISPLMGPIIGIGFSASTYKLDLLKDSIKNYFFATVVSLITSTIYFLLSPIDDAQTELLARTSPNIYDVLIALFGGFAGIAAITSKHKGNILPGAAIATALMPPLCTAGYGIATWQLSFSLGALYLYFINTVFIILSSYLYLKFTDFPIQNEDQNPSSIRTNRIIFWVSVITILPSIYLGYDLINKNQFIRNANKYINNEFNLTNTLVVKRSINPSKQLIQLYTFDLNSKRIDEKQNLEKSNSTLINIIDSLTSKQLVFRSLVNEIKFVDSNIDTIYIINNTLSINERDNQNITVILEKSRNGSAKAIDSSKILSWFKTRLPNDSVRIKILK